MTIQEVAKVGRVSTTTVRRLIEVGVLLSVRPLPQKIMVLEASVNQWLNSAHDPEFWNKDLRKKMRFAVDRHRKK